MDDSDFSALVAPPPSTFWDENPPDSPHCFERLQSLLRTRINVLPGSRRSMLWDRVKDKEFAPAKIPTAKRKRIFHQAFNSVIDPIVNKTLPQESRRLRIPGNQMHRIPTMSEENEKKLRETYIARGTTFPSVHRIHREWCEAEPRTFSEYLDHADLVSGMKARVKGRQKSRRAGSLDRRTPGDSAIFKRSLDNQYVHKDLESVYQMYEQWLKKPHTRDEYIDHADVICNVEDHQSGELSEDYDRPLQLGSRAKKRKDLKRWYGKMSVQKMHQAHRQWCQKELHYYEEYLDHAAIVSELDLLSNKSTKQIDPEERHQRTPEQCVEFRQMYWNRYHDKPLEDIYWDREFWLRAGPHTVEEYRDHLDIVREMEERPNQPALSVEAGDTSLEPLGETRSVSRRAKKNVGPQSNNIAGISSTPRRSSRIAASGRANAISTTPSRSPSKKPVKRNALAPTGSQDGAGVKKPGKLQKGSAIASTPASTKRRITRRDKSVMSSLTPSRRTNFVTESATSPQEEGSNLEAIPSPSAKPAPLQLTSFERSLLEKDGWKWYPHAAPLFPFSETRYIAAVMNFQMKVDLMLGPGTSSVSLDNPPFFYYLNT